MAVLVAVVHEKRVSVEEAGLSKHQVVRGQVSEEGVGFRGDGGGGRHAH